jgi:hypothetical protein
METPMVTDLRKLRDSDSDPVDSSLYRQLIGSLMYLVNTQTKHFLCCEHIEPVPGGT